MKKTLLVISCIAAVSALVPLAIHFKGEKQTTKEASAPSPASSVRTITRGDGSRSEFAQTPDGKTMTKKDFNPGGTLSSSTVYRLDKERRLLAAKVYDAGKQELLKVSFGYGKDDGILREERIFDSRTRHFSPEDGRELPVCRIIHMPETPEQKAESRAITLIPTDIALGSVYGDFSDPFKN